jgi:hypothetical protein
VWGVFAAGFLVFLAARLPEHLQAGAPGPLLRDAGLVLVSINMIAQAIRTSWPALYSLGLTVVGIALWATGALLPDSVLDR